MPWGEGEGLGVGAEGALREAAKQPHHGQIHLAVASVDGGIDQGRGAAGAHVEVAAAQIAMEPRWWLLLADPALQGVEQPIEAATHVSREQASGVWHAQLGEEPLAPVELRPGCGGTVRLGQGTDEVVLLEAEPGCSRAMEPREPAPEVLVEIRSPPSGLQELEDEEGARRARADRQHARDRQRRGGVSVFEGAAEPLEPPGLRLEHAFGGVSSCLCEDAAPIGELQDVSLADVTSCD